MEVRFGRSSSDVSRKPLMRRSTSLCWRITVCAPRKVTRLMSYQVRVPLRWKSLLHRVPRDKWQVTGSSEVLELPTASPPRAWEPKVGDGEGPQDPNTSPKKRQGSAARNRVAFGQGTVMTQGADGAAARAGDDGSVRAPPTQSVAAGSAHVEECAGVVARANKSGRVGTPTTQGVVAGSARATEGAGACARATTSGRARAPTSKAIKGDKVTGTPKAEASSRGADSAAEDRVLQVLDVFTGEPKAEEVLTPLPTVADLLEVEELSYVVFLDCLKAGEWAEVVLLRPDGGVLELNYSSVMDSEVLEDERTSRRQTRYGAAILKDPSDPYHPLLKGFRMSLATTHPRSFPRIGACGMRLTYCQALSIVPRGSGRFRRNRSKSSTPSSRRSMPLAWCVNHRESPHSSPTFCVRKPNGKWPMVHAFKLNATVPASTPIPQNNVL
ncbi:unnamed protein product [Phytophthora fragariaefolia]|uniref:Unnamed protein product n=1 Tax=Phytophthora fragariaefolia TaxID=1490495 RepID=A0A9W6XEK2_9STRA|nr:unnamed protein product [Phytophthora fragariaefolia]